MPGGNRLKWVWGDAAHVVHRTCRRRPSVSVTGLASACARSCTVFGLLCHCVRTAAQRASPAASALAALRGARSRSSRAQLALVDAVGRGCLARGADAAATAARHATPRGEAARSGRGNTGAEVVDSHGHQGCWCVACCVGRTPFAYASQTYGDTERILQRRRLCNSFFRTVNCILDSCSWHVHTSSQTHPLRRRPL